MKSLPTIFIKIQSAIDVITNSSTSIYTVANEWTLNHIRKIIDAAMEVAGSTLKADDLFDFELEVPNADCEEDYREEFVEKIIMGDVLTDEEQTLVESYQNQKYESLRNSKGVEYRKIRMEYDDLIYSIVRPYITTKFIEDYFDNSHYGYYNRGYKVIPKQDIESHRDLAKVLSNLQNLFDINASYD